MAFGSLGLGIQMNIRGITEEEVATCMFLCVAFTIELPPAFPYAWLRCMTRLQYILSTETLFDFPKSYVDFKMAYT